MNKETIVDNQRTESVITGISMEWGRKRFDRIRNSLKSRRSYNWRPSMREAKKEVALSDIRLAKRLEEERRLGPAWSRAFDNIVVGES